MARLETTHRPSLDHRDAAVALTDAVGARLGHRPLSDQHWLELCRPDHDAVPLAFAWNASGALAGFAVVAGDSAQIVLDDPRDGALTADLLAAIRSSAPDAAWLVFDASAEHDAVAARAGLAPGRSIVQMRRPLPLNSGGPGVPTRPFRVGVDEDAWLAVNARAFAGHPDQAGWRRDDLLAREAEPWFDPAGFLVHERDGRIAAFCWTKVHTEEAPPSGEIYVIAVDPDFHGQGLGRALTVAGLRHLAGRGITAGMLFVDGDNTAALALYESLGFVRHRVDRVYGTATP